MLHAGFPVAVSRTRKIASSLVADGTDPIIPSIRNIDVAHGVQRQGGGDVQLSGGRSSTVAGVARNAVSTDRGDKACQRGYLADATVPVIRNVYVPAGSTSTPPGKSSSALVAGPPSPE